MTRDVLELAGSLAYLDDLAQQYEQQPNAVDASWHSLLENGHGGNGNGHAEPKPQPQPQPSSNGNGSTTATQAPPPPYFSTDPSRPNMPRMGRPGAITTAPITIVSTKQPSHIWPLVNAWRSRGHFAARLDPLNLLETAWIQELEPDTWGFTERDMDKVIEPTGVHGMPRATVGEIVKRLREVYAGSVGIEYMHISSPARRSWLAERMETQFVKPLTREVRARMLELLINSEQFERFCHTKYPGTKRFSLEGSESLIPCLDLVLTHGARLGAIEAVMGMAHRGRLTTIEQIVKRPSRDLFSQFEDVEPEKSMGGGDVKYHMGFSTDRIDPNGRAMHVSLSFNPSHLEAVDPVVVGRVRAKQMRHHDIEHRQVMGILVHGDAAFAGQGLVPETLQLSGLPGYRTGGTVHIIVNNQVGFTASPAEQRSTPYCTDVAKMLECPIWHVNGEDLDALAHVVEIACEFRAQFSSDVIIDIYCYRKYGHNEGDEPSFTQPLMYEVIRQKASPVEVYSKRLVGEGVLTPDQITEMTKKRVSELEGELEAAKTTKQRPDAPSMTAMWRGYRGGVLDAPDDADTRVPRQLLENITAAMTELPQGFTAHPKIERLLAQRAEMGKGDRPIDWGMAELLAYGSLLYQKVNVRLTGQDCARGTFSHRHAIVTDIKTAREHLVLGALHPDQGQCRIYDSPLSEAGVLGFEFGYSLDYPDGLTIWEAQFGDFVNGAQVIIDQFITASEDKWKRLSGIVLYLPHGYEGQGPEHSSARLERFLESCGEHNIQVCQPTTPAQMFHMVRTQVLRRYRKPLIVMTPKSLLRLPAATSTLDELASGRFHRVLHDELADPDKVTRVLMCSGKIYYELADERARRADPSVAIIRLEKLYPWWPNLVEESFAKYSKLGELFWVQDEPCNMGAGNFVTPRLHKLIAGKSIKYDFIGRAESASPATGSHKAHVLEQQQILRSAFEPR